MALKIEQATKIAGEIVSSEGLAGIVKVDITFDQYADNGELLFTVGIYNELRSNVPDWTIRNQRDLDRFYANV